MSIVLIFTSLLAGMLSVLAPCVIGILPVLMARSIDNGRVKSFIWVLLGLGGSIFIFSILLKSTTLLIDVPDVVWRSISGAIIVAFGVTMLWPRIWETIALKLGFALKSQQLLAKSAKTHSRVGDVLIGASLGPVFSACSPTYLLIVATILPTRPLEGMVYLLVYIFGLIAMTSAVILLGQGFVKKLGWGVDPDGMFRKILGILSDSHRINNCIGIDKTILGWLVTNGWFDWQTAIEQSIS